MDYKIVNMEYVTNNKLTAVADQQKNSSRRAIMMPGITIAVGVFYSYLYVIFHVFHNVGSLGFAIWK